MPRHRDTLPHRSRALLETLESRVLLNGLTIITHGYEPASDIGLGASRPGWIDTMGKAIRARAGDNMAIYALRLTPVNGSTVHIGSFTRLSGTSPTDENSTDGEAVLLIDWASVSGVVTQHYSTTYLASVITPYLLLPHPGAGVDAPLVEGPIQLIGHSRGASLVSEIAKDLGKVGIWVDQLTTLDPVPVASNNDAAIVVRTNVIFADNYYQHDGGFVVPNGSPVSGAKNIGPLSLDGGYGTFDGGSHNNVFLYYYGTINTALNANNGDHTVPNSWYGSNNETRALNRASTGFYYSRIGGGVRPVSGIAKDFGGTAARSSVTRSGAQWPNIAFVTPSTMVIAPGQDFSVSFKYQAYSAAANVQWYFDPDTNPYNGNSIPLGSSNFATTSSTIKAASVTLTNNLTSGSYHIEGRISNASGTRYAYTAATVIFSNVAPIGAVDEAGPVVSGWSIDQNTPGDAVSVRLDVDGATFATMPANLKRPELQALYGSTNHGFSFDLSAITPGIHRIDVYALDSTDGTPVLLDTETITTNHPATGQLTRINNRKYRGWAFDTEAGAAPIQISYSVDDNPPVLAVADINRPGLASALKSTHHGFKINLSQLPVGTHVLSVYGVDSSNSSLTLIGQQTFTVGSPSNLLPKGIVETVSTNEVSGWAYDPSQPRASIKVRVDVDGVAGTPFSANLARPDVNQMLHTSGNYGFDLALALTPGAHRIDVYALDSVSRLPVLLSSEIVGAAVPAGSLDVLNGTQAVGWAYLSALMGAAVAVRLDIDGLTGPTVSANLVNANANTTLGIAGNFGYVIPMPTLAPGPHSVTINVLDPLTLLTTPIATQSLVTA